MKKMYNLYAVYYKRNGEKKEVLFSSKADLINKRKQLKKNRRKFLGYRELQLTEP